MAEAKPLKIQRGDKSLDRANRVVASHIIFHTRRKKARLIPAYPGLEGTIRHTESYTALHKRLGSCPASQRNPGDETVVTPPPACDQSPAARVRAHGRGAGSDPSPRSRCTCPA